MTALADLLPAPVKSGPDRIVYEVPDAGSSTPWLVVAWGDSFTVVNASRRYREDDLDEAGVRELLTGVA